MIYLRLYISDFNDIGQENKTNKQKQETGKNEADEVKQGKYLTDTQIILIWEDQVWKTPIIYKPVISNRAIWNTFHLLQKGKYWNSLFLPIIYTKLRKLGWH